MFCAVIRTFRYLSNPEKTVKKSFALQATASLLLIVLTILFASCKQKVPTPEPAETAAAPVSDVKHPGWAYNLGIYEVNVRQYTPEGTFAAFQEHLPRLRELGVGIVWLMPIHPIGEKNRKGTLGSYYSVRDYLAVNPEFGTKEDFRQLVDAIHEQGMFVIIDWVANHCAWDNPLVEEHPDWFTRDSTGSMIPPVPDWSDVVDFNYDNPDLRRYMTDALLYWVREFNIDGYRCDVAGMLPMDFWNAARPELEKIKPVFMLAEWDTPDCHEKAFDMTYAWDLMHTMNGIAAGERPVADLDSFFTRDSLRYPPDGCRMLFITNHDENSWNGTAFERLGEGAEAFAVLTATARGMPLIYSGQEAGLDKRLEFFERDPIEWKKHRMGARYAMLLQLKKENRALWNGIRGGAMVRVPTTNDAAVYSFIREKDDDKVLVVLNLTGHEHSVVLRDKSVQGRYTDLFANRLVSLKENARLNLKPWEYRVYVK